LLVRDVTSTAVIEVFQENLIWEDVVEKFEIVLTPYQAL
jgi:hypothetical protein